MTKTQFKKLANDLRRATPRRWVFLREQVNGCWVGYKASGTWVQIFEVELPDKVIKDGGLCDQTVKQYGEYVDSMLALIPGE